MCIPPAYIYSFKKPHEKTEEATQRNPLREPLRYCEIPQHPHRITISRADAERPEPRPAQGCLAFSLFTSANLNRPAF